VAKATALQLLICVEHGVWGASRDRLKKWKAGDDLVIIGDDFLGLAEISGAPFTSEDLIFDGAFYPYRVPIDFVHIIGPADVPDAPVEIRRILAERYGKHSGWPILLQVALPEDIGQRVLQAIRSRLNVLNHVKRNLNSLLEKAAAKAH
jgi:hypothetical protein